MFNKLLLAIFSIFTLVSCSAQKTTPPTKSLQKNTSTKNIQQVIYFNEGENKFLKEYQINITFRKVSEDSRCPKGVNCIWAGAAVADIELMGTYTRPITVRLSTVKNEERGYQNSTEFNGYRISLKSVSPYPDAKSDLKKLEGKYQIGIIIEKIDHKTSTVDPKINRGGTTTK